jgi:hypothetical protein
MDPESALLPDTEVEVMLARATALGEALKALVPPRKRQEAPMEKADALTCTPRVDEYRR